LKAQLNQSNQIKSNQKFSRKVRKKTATKFNTIAANATARAGLLVKQWVVFMPIEYNPHKNFSRE